MSATPKMFPLIVGVWSMAVSLGHAAEPPPAADPPPAPVVIPGKPKGAWPGEYPIPKPPMPEGPVAPACPAAPSDGSPDGADPAECAVTEPAAKDAAPR